MDPDSTGGPGVYLYSSATPHGSGVHGMGGHDAARSVRGSLGALNPVVRRSDRRLRPYRPRLTWINGDRGPFDAQETI